jgi:XTP/dITP diphosphohydrolase
VPEDLPALLYAHKVLRKADAAGHPWTGHDGDPPADAGDLGERLLALVATARRADLDPETALRAAAARVRDRVKAAEAAGA